MKFKKTRFWLADIFSKLERKLYPKIKIENIPLSDLGSCLFSGIDAKIYINEKIMDNIQKVKIKPSKTPIYTMGRADPIAFTKDKPKGKITLVLFKEEHHKELLSLLGAEKTIRINECNEFGELIDLYEAVVKFDDHELLGISVDDLILEIELGFTVVSRKNQKEK